MSFEERIVRILRGIGLILIGIAVSVAFNWIPGASFLGLLYSFIGLWYVNYDPVKKKDS